MKFRHDVFVSHSSKDKAVALEIAERLRQAGLRVWLDRWEIAPGDSIPAKIEAGLEYSRVLVFLMSANSFGSEWAELESGTFRFRDPMNRARRLIPVKIDHAPIKGSLAQFRHIDWRATGEAKYDDLLTACHPPNPVLKTTRAKPTERGEKLLAKWNTRGSRILTDHEIQCALDEGLLAIQGFVPAHLRSASYELTISDLRIASDLSRQLEPDRSVDCYMIPPKELLLAHTKEKLVLPDRIVGRLGPTSDLIELGLVANLGLQVDPGYAGAVYFGLENRLSKTVAFAADQPALAIEFYLLAAPPQSRPVEKAGGNGAFARIEK